jgi:hypothetical protein
MLRSLAAYFGSSLTAAFTALEMARDVPQAFGAVTEWIVTRSSFAWWFYGILAFSGVALLAAGRPGSLLSRLLAKAGDAPAVFYGGASGAALGWAVGQRLAASANSVDNLPGGTWGSMAVILAVTVAPLVAYQVCASSARGVNSTLFRTAWRVRLLQATGAAIAISAGLGLITEMRA